MCGIESRTIVVFCRLPVPRGEVDGSVVVDAAGEDVDGVGLVGGGGRGLSSVEGEHCFFSYSFALLYGD